MKGYTIWGDVCGEFRALILGDLLNDYEGDDDCWDELLLIGWVCEINGGCVSCDDATWLCERERRKAYRVPYCTNVWKDVTERLHCTDVWER